MRSLGASEARNNLAEILEQVHYGRERVAIERRGKPFAALVPIEDLELLRSGEIERLRESEARLRSILEHAPAEIYLTDARGRYLEANRRYKERWGLTDQEIRGKLPGDIHDDPAFAEAGRSHDLAVLESGRAIEQEDTTELDGRPLTLRVIKFPVRDEAGEISGLGAIALDVTEHKQAEESVRKAQTLFEETERLARLGHWEWDKIEDRCTYCSEELARLHGVTVEEYLARASSTKADLEWVHPEDRERVERSAKEARKEQTGFDIEYRMVRDDGEVVQVREVAETFLDEYGALVRTVGFMQDITERKQAEETLRESEALLKQAARMGRLGHWVWDDRSNSYIICSEELGQLYGYSADDYVKRYTAFDSLLENIHPDDRDLYERAVTASKEDRSAYDVEFRERTADGEVRYFREYGEPVRDQDGQLLHTMGIVQDITEFKKVEQALRDSERALARAQRQARIGSWRWSVERDALISCSEEFARIHSVDPGEIEDLLAHQMERVVHPDDRDRVAAKFKRFDEEGVDYEIEFRIVRPDGTVRHVLEIGEAVRDETGRAVEQTGTVQDITERKRAEDALKRVRDQLEQRVEERTAELSSANEALTREIAERKLAEEEAERSRELLASAVEALDEGFVIFDAEDRLVLSNSKYRSIYWPASDAWEPGTPLAQVSRDTAAVFIGLKAEEDIEAWVRGYLERHRQHGQQFDQPFVDGRWIQVAEYPLPNGWTVGTRIDISEVKRAEQELRGSEAQLKQAQTMAKVGTFVWDDVTNSCAFCSEELASLLNMSVEEFMNKRGRHDVLLSLIHEDDRDRYQQVIDNSNESLEPYDVEYKIYDNDGNLRYWREMGRPQLNDRGRLAHTFGTVQDITDMRRAEEALRESEELFRSVVDNSPSAIFLKDRNGRFRLVNPRFEEWYGVSSPDILGRTSHDIYPPEFATKYIALDKEVLETGKAREQELDVPFADGEVHSVLITKFPVVGNDGEITGVGTINTDVTERKVMSEELARSEDRLRQATELVGLGYAIWDTVEDRCLYCSEEFARIHGTTVEDYMERVSDMEGDWSFTHPDDRDAYKAVIKRVRRGESAELEYRVLTPAGETRHVQEVVKPVQDDSGAVIQEYSTILDVTETKHAEEQLRQAQKMEAIGQLTGGVAHDFNNLLAVIVGNAEFLEDQLGKDDKVVQGIMQAATRGAELTERLLAFSRRQPLNPRPTDLGALIENMTGLMRRTLGETIEIKTVRAAGLRDALADSGQLENAILNLAINARDAMPGGGKLLIETLNATLDEDAASQMEIPSGDYVVVAVSDTGIGMPAEVQEHVFEPFFTTKDVGEGSGLGLSMVYGFAKQSGGSVTINSEPKHGTTVRIYLPGAREKVEPAGAQTASDVPRGRGEVLLVVEDDPEVRALAERMLDGLGYRVVAAGDASAGLEALEETPDVELLLSDVVLPGGMNGLDFAKEARTRRPALKVLFMSGYAGSAVFQNNLRAEGVEALQKPFRKLDLAQKIRAALDE